MFTMKDVFVSVKLASSVEDEYVQFAFEVLLDHAKNPNSDIEETLRFVVANLQAGLEDNPNNKLILKALETTEAFIARL